MLSLSLSHSLSLSSAQHFCIFLLQSVPPLSLAVHTPTAWYCLRFQENCLPAILLSCSADPRKDHCIERERERERERDSERERERERGGESSHAINGYILTLSLFYISWQ